MTQIDLVGTETSGFKFIKQTIENFMNFQEWNYELMQYSKIDDIIKFNVNSVPTIRLNESFNLEIAKEDDFFKGINLALHKIIELNIENLLKAIIIRPRNKSELINFVSYINKFNKHKYFVTAIDGEELNIDEKSILKLAENNEIGNIYSINPYIVIKERYNYHTESLFLTMDGNRIKSKSLFFN